MQMRVLGAAAGGGFPQWNANSEACRRARAGDPAARPATQASVAVSADGECWVLVNASPDLRQQIEVTPALQPKTGLRSSPIAAVVLTNGDVDAIAGLLHLREGTPFALYAHARVHRVLDRNPIFEVVDRTIVPRRELVPETATTLEAADGRPLGLTVLPFLAPGKLPLYLEREAGSVLDTAALEGDTLGLEIEADGRRVVYLANCARLTEPLLGRIAGADVLFLDGTLWCDDEMILQGVGRKTGQRMGHISMSGPEGAIARLRPVPVDRRIFLHINNTNPALLADSPERMELERAGWEVAFDGMELSL
ncbi:pyrroloquinoline quinone biosynthesis protein PqqB [Benzoatithermus flavus]|uniref:Coenzyme PQQ synthesis protein B n=1 Tax=Benzoatithermus flavus TaxID=3108223 RepID=A0ABU8XPW1_9PROT